jgi:hypothetical protein
VAITVSTFKFLRQVWVHSRQDAETNIHLTAKMLSIAGETMGDAALEQNALACQWSSRVGVSGDLIG